jgi:hypothetical protein
MFRKADREIVRRHTRHNREEVLASSTCGCIGCLATFQPSEISEWTEEADRDQPEAQVDRTAVCPHCGDTLIIGDKSGHEITPTFLEAMRMR